jgi:thioredoxin
MNSGHTRK